jgi:Amt family ammonium transporter
LHDIDFELYPEEHCLKAPELLREGGVGEDIIHSVCSHGYGITVGCGKTIDVEPVHEMEKVLFAADELTGLDVSEHGLPSAYADFMPAVEKYAELGSSEEISVVTGTTPPAEAVPVKREPVFAGDGHKFTKIEIVFKEEKLFALKDAMSKLGITGMTVSHVMGYGMQKGHVEYYRGVAVETDLRPKVQMDIVVSAIPVRDVIETAKKVLYTGHIGDGKIFVYDVENVVKVRTGEEGYDALQDVE